MLLTRRRPFLNPRSLFILGGFAILVGIYSLAMNFEFLRHMERTEAEVVAVETVEPNDPFAKYRPHVVFETADGERMNVPVADTYRPTESGERLGIAYDPRDPTDARLMDPRDEWLIALYPLVFGLITVAMAVRRLRGGRADPPAAD